VVDNFLKSISYFCPAYNEQENLEKAVTSVLAVLKEINALFEIIIVDNGSLDKTPQMADQFAKTYPQIKVIHHVSNREYGGALKSGFMNVANEIVVYTDSDNQYDFNDFKKMLPYLENYDVVMGVRENRHDSIYRKIQSAIFNLLLKALFGLKAKDINCSFKVYKKKVLDSIDICSNSAFIDAEMYIRARKKGYKICEVAVQHFPRQAGKATGAKPHVVLLTIKEIFCYWLRFIGLIREEKF